MKKLLCILLAVMTICPLLAACGGTQEQANTAKTSAAEETSKQTTAEPTAEPTPTPTPTPTEEPTPTPTPTPTEEPTPTPEPEPDTAEFDKTKFYEIKTTKGDRLEWRNSKIEAAKDEEGTFWSIDTVTTGKNNTKSSVFFAGDMLQSVLEADRFTGGGALKCSRFQYASNGTNKQRWQIKANGDGTYKIIPQLTSEFALSIDDGVVGMKKVDEASNFIITEYDFKPTKYAVWFAEKGNLSVRLPIDVVDQIYKRIKREKVYKGMTEEELKAHIDERMQLFAESAQKCYDSLIELTDFTPYPRIIIYAYEHQDVMAGVVGNDPDIWVNIDWYVDDMVKMMLRWDDAKGRKEDYNFCILHEMGHMFDWERGWNFESEMETDLKASYVLYAHRSDEFGAWAAPAEYEWNKVWNIDTIDTGGYRGLSGGAMKFVEKDDEYRFTYSIYRSAQMYVSYIKYCEETEGLVGFEALKQMFHWFQSEGLKTTSMKTNTGSKRFYLMNEKLTEFTGYDINKFMIETYSEEEWKATEYNTFDNKVREKNASGQETGWQIVAKEKTEE